MGQEDRDWYKQDRERREKLVISRKRRGRWPYRLRPGLPWWIMAFVLAYYAWRYFQ